MIKLTATADGLPVWVNEQAIRVMHEYPRGTHLAFTHDIIGLTVKETPEVVLMKIREAERSKTANCMWFQ